MDSLKMFKGYGKVEHEQHHLEDHCNPKPKPKFSKPFIATISIFAILFLTLTFAFALASILHHTKSQQQLLINLVESIRFVCNVTRFPSACLPAIPPSANIANPLQSLNSMLETKNSRAPANCRIHLDDVLGRLSDSLLAWAALTEVTISDVQTWASMAMTDQETCLDGLEEVGDVATMEEMKKIMKRANEYTSNSLAIVANIHNLLQRFYMALH
ncbi:Pectinesterase 3 [Glycine soja]